jgi:chromosome segregation ATPase
MEPELALEQQIRSQVEELRAQFPQTKDLYREVCALLFFRYGVTPTANKLYQLVRKGSMSAPLEALANFWKDLREKSRVRIEHPDLPEDLKSAAGELVASLWGKAQSLAHESLTAFREEARTSVLEAQSKQTAAEERQKELSQELLTTQQDLAAAMEQNRSFEQQIAAAAATQARMEKQFQHEREAREQLQHVLDATRSAMENTRHGLEDATRELESTRQELQTTRQRLTAEVETLQAAIEEAEARHQSEEKGLSAQLDQARAKSDQLERDLVSIHSVSAAAAEQHRVEAAKLQCENGNLRQQLGVLEGTLQSAVAQREELSKVAHDLRGQNNELNGEVGAARVEAEIWKRQAQSLEERLAKLSQTLQTRSTDSRA